MEEKQKSSTHYATQIPLSLSSFIITRGYNHEQPNRRDERTVLAKMKHGLEGPKEKLAGRVMRPTPLGAASPRNLPVMDKLGE